MIYFIQDETGPIKIGFSKNVKQRIYSYTTHNPRKIKVLAIIHGTKLEEKRLHNLFRNFCIRNEWYPI